MARKKEVDISHFLDFIEKLPDDAILTKTQILNKLYKKETKIKYFKKLTVPITDEVDKKLTQLCKKYKTSRKVFINALIYAFDSISMYDLKKIGLDFEYCLNLFKQALKDAGAKGSK